MRFLSVVCAAAVLCSSMYAAEVPAVAPAPADETMVSIKEEFLSNQVFRGKLLNEDPIMKSQVGVEKGLFGFNVTGYNDLTNIHDNTFDVSELDLNIYVKDEVYSNPAGKFVNEVTVFGGFELFTYPGDEGGESTLEAYAGIDTMSKKLAGVHTKTVLHYDIDEADGCYLESAMYRPIDIKKAAFNIGKQSFTTTATPEIGMGWGSASYNDYHWGSEGSATTDWDAALKVICESKNFMFGPSITYTDLVNPEIQDDVDQSSNWTYGFMAGIKF